MPFITQGKTNWKFLLIVIILAIAVGAGAFTLARQKFPVINSFIFPKSCKSLHDGIEKEFEDANFCNQDSDCKTMSLGGQYITFGCYKFVNKSTNEQALYDKMEKYYQKCTSPIDECMPTPESVCVNNKCTKKIADETVNWKNYSDPKAVFAFKYPTDWEIKTDYQYKSASCRINPNCEGIHYIFLNKISDSRPSNLGEIEKFGVGINMPQCAGIKMDSLPGNNWICVFDNNSEILGIYEKIKNSFQLIEEIKIGKVEINYEEINTIQQSVDEGHQSWRLNPVMVLRSEMSLYGFNPDTDYSSLYPVPDVATQEKFGTKITEVNLEITHNGKAYVITLIQPITGPNKVWTISDIELK